MPPLNPLLAFEAAARHESFTRAATELNVTQGAVSRQVAVLEQFFGDQLFERRTGGVVLTPRGAAYAAKVSKAFNDLHRATLDYQSAAANATITIKGYPLFLNRWLIPRLADFARTAPHISVRLIGTSGASHVDFTKENVDLGIRYGRGRWRGLTSDLLLRDELVLLCSPKLVPNGQLTQPGDLQRHTLLQTYARDRDWADWSRLAGVSINSKQVKSFEDLSLVRQCALDGIGIAIMQKAYVEADIAAGSLMVPFGPTLKRDLGYFLICPTERADVHEIATFRTWLLRLLAPELCPPA